MVLTWETSYSLSLNETRKRQKKKKKEGYTSAILKLAGQGRGVRGVRQLGKTLL